MSDFRITFVDTKADMAEALRIRRRVFIDEQKVPEELEIDEHDAERAWGRSAIHALLWKDGQAVATGRLVLEDGSDHYAHVGRVAVLIEERGSGIGRTLMRALQERAHKLGYPGITLAAQLHAVGFYEKLGYVARGEGFLDAGIEHRWMDLSFDSEA